MEMKTLDEIKEEVAKELGYRNWNVLRSVAFCNFDTEKSQSVYDTVAAVPI